MLSTKGLSKAAVLAALYNASKAQGMGMLQYDPTPMTEADAQDLLKKSPHFDYLKGRVMKLDMSDEDQFEERLYDRDNGVGAAFLVLESLRASKDVNNKTISTMHKTGLYAAAQHIENTMHEESEMETDENGVTVITLGFDDEIRNRMRPVLDEILGKVSTN